MGWDESVHLPCPEWGGHNGVSRIIPARSRYHSLSENIFS